MTREVKHIRFSERILNRLKRRTTPRQYGSACESAGHFDGLHASIGQLWVDPGNIAG
jgi:hypothetical protein